MLHRSHAAYCLERFGRTFVTPLRIDRGHVLAMSARCSPRSGRREGYWPFLVGSAALVAPRRPRGERFDGLALLLFGLSVLPGLVLVRYFRTIEFAGRYLSLPTFWALAAVVHGLVGLACALAGRFRGLVLALGLVALVVAVPPAPPAPLTEARADAARLARGGDRRCCWRTTSTSTFRPSLAPRGVLVPIGAEGNLNRFPREPVSAAASGHGWSSAPCSGRPTGPDAGAARGAASPRRGRADPRARRSLVCRHAVERAAAPVPAPLAEDDVRLLVHPHADVTAPQLAQLDEEAVAERPHASGVEEPPSARGRASPDSTRSCPARS
jgi:hypothetical protein